MSKKFLIVLCACLSPLFFPWQLVIALTIVATWFFPWSAVMVGTIEDMLYAPSFTTHSGFLIGLAISLCMLGVRYIVKTRIMEA